MLGLGDDSTLHQFRNAVQAGLILRQRYVKNIVQIKHKIPI